MIGRKRALCLSPGQVAVACDTNIDRANALANSLPGEVTVTTSADEAIANQKVNAVVLATVNRSLAELAKIAIEAGRPVLIEKPAATSTAQLDELIRLAERKRLPVRVGYNHRFHPAFRMARELVAGTNVGPLMFIRGRYGHGGRLGYEKEWRADPELAGGGELIDQGVHLIDLARWFLGNFTKAQGHVATYYWQMAVEDNAFVDLRTTDGKTAWLHASCTEWKNLFSFEIFCRHAKLHIEGLGGSYGTERLTYYQMRPELGPPDTTIWEFPRPDESWRLEMEAFTDDIRLGRTPVPGLVDARAALRVVEQIYEQSRDSNS